MLYVFAAFSANCVAADRTKGNKIDVNSDAQMHTCKNSPINQDLKGVNLYQTKMANYAQIKQQTYEIGEEKEKRKILIM